MADWTQKFNWSPLDSKPSGNYLPFLLEDLNLVEIELQVIETTNSKISRYIFKDPFFLFRYRYVQKNMVLLQMGQTNRVVRKIADDLPNLEGRVLEMIIREKILARSPINYRMSLIRRP